MNFFKQIRWHLIRGWLSAFMGVWIVLVVVPEIVMEDAMDRAVVQLRGFEHTPFFGGSTERVAAPGDFTAMRISAILDFDKNIGTAPLEHLYQVASITGESDLRAVLIYTRDRRCAEVPRKAYFEMKSSVSQRRLPFDIQARFINIERKCQFSDVSSRRPATGRS